MEVEGRKEDSDQPCGRLMYTVSLHQNELGII